MERLAKGVEMTGMDGLPNRSQGECVAPVQSVRPGIRFVASLLAGVVVIVAGCDGGGHTSGSPPPPSPPAVIAPAISTQPTDQSVPMGLTATYSVMATGSSLQYQWAKDGAAIIGATSSSYVTPAAQFSDTGTTFTVTVSNSTGTLTSSPATLTVTARAPMAGDLRFQLVDSALTVNGYFNTDAGLSTFLIRGAQYFGGNIGTPLWIGGGNCAIPPTTDGVGCAWPFEVSPLATSLGAIASGFTTGYASDYYDNFTADLTDPTWDAFPNTDISPVTSSSVITSLDLEPADILFGLSWVQSTQSSGFQLVQQTVAPADFQAAATQEGVNGRVITAVSNNSGQITFISYAWQADTATVYEAQVTTASPADTLTAAANLAAVGYIITAVGQADDSGDIVMVGTRVQGDTMARPFVMAQAPSDIANMQAQGYATVGVVTGAAQGAKSGPNPYAQTYLGER